MSECVVRMEMPENCFECPFSIIDDTADGAWCNALANQVYGFPERDEDCPIICSLPEGHGRLVDKDEVIESIRTEMTELFFNGLKGTPRPDSDLRFMWNRLEDEDFAPTIVPATEGGNHEAD